MQAETVSYYLCVIPPTFTGTTNADERGSIGSSRKMETCAFKPICAYLFSYLHIHVAYKRRRIRLTDENIRSNIKPVRIEHEPAVCPWLQERPAASWVGLTGAQTADWWNWLFPFTQMSPHLSITSRFRPPNTGKTSVNWASSAEGHQVGWGWSTCCVRRD